MNLNLKEVQKIEFEILCVFKSFCEENNLKFFLTAGTLLGAIRHSGFIPWDDDIDVTMLRPDYQIFIQKTKGIVIKNKYKVEFYDRTEGYIYPFCKLVDTTTILIESVDKRECGIYIDIFPTDKLPDNIKERNKFMKKVARLRECATASYDYYIKPQSIFRNIAKRLLRPYCRLVGIKRWVQKIDLLASKYDKINYENTWEVVWASRQHEVCSINIYSIALFVDFCGEKMPVPYGYDELLKKQFGDYMTPPPENERIGHNFTAYIKESLK